MSADETARRSAKAALSLARDGVVVREAVAEFGALYPVLKAMEEAGRIRRGYFVEGLGAAQFALPGVEERLRSLRTGDDETPALMLASCDPASPWGAALPWPRREGARPMRASGTYVIARAGELLAWVGRRAATVTLYLPDSPPERRRALAEIARALAWAAEQGRFRPLVISEVDGAPARQSPLGPALLAEGFTPSGEGYVTRRTVEGLRPPQVEVEEDEEVVFVPGEAGDDEDGGLAPEGWDA
jgi:ATP-dependent Lhr-like helicase